MTPEECFAIKKCMEGVYAPVIVELGAWKGGEDFAAILGREPAKHIMLEPDPRNFGHIEQKKYQTAWQFAVGAETGTRKFYMSDDEHREQGSGSLLEPTGHKQHFPHIKFLQTTTVRVVSLDHLFALSGIVHIDLLYADVQGAEAEMIAGGRKALARTAYLFMEADEVEFYAGQKTKTDLLAMLSGWEVVEDFGYNVLLRNKRKDEIHRTETTETNDEHHFDLPDQETAR